MGATILVTGGTGRLGRLVVERLSAAGCAVRALARHPRELAPGVTFCAADLRSGEGIGPAVSGVEVIVHCATSTKGDVEATTNLLTAAVTAGTPHVVHVSIVGIEAIASWGYPKRKLATEQLVENSGLPWTILRATQFYDYIYDNSRRLSRCPIVPVPAGFRVAPVDAADVADRLAELALAPAAGRVADIAGPQESDWAAMLRDYLKATRRHRLLIPLRMPGTRAVRAGGLLPGPDHLTGVRTWDEYLTGRN
jgi:uncharacterized protein YbjT (DUF2867 family)